MTPEPIDVQLWRADREVSGADMRARAGEGARGGFSNVSHTKGLTVLASAPVRVGVDVEQVRARPYLDRLARRSMTDDEYERWRTADDRVRTFTRHWTRVEAHLKGLGVGVRGGLRTRPSREWTIVDLDVGDDHCGTLALETHGRDVALHWRA